MRPIERRLSKVEDASGPPGDLRFMPDWQLHALICREMTVECREGKTIEEIAAAHRANGEDEVAEMFANEYVWDPVTRTVSHRDGCHLEPKRVKRR
jgi:hypothetical protein